MLLALVIGACPLCMWRLLMACGKYDNENLLRPQSILTWKEIPPGKKPRAAFM